MNRRLAAAASVTLALLAGGVFAEETLKSGPQVGSSKITPFNPLHATGPGAGGKQCLV
jgi:hypothetical protein